MTGYCFACPASTQVASKPARLHCPTCDETYALPRLGSFKLFNELKCPLDDFELLLWSGGPNAKGYPLCPYCYVYPPFKCVRLGPLSRRRRLDGMETCCVSTGKRKRATAATGARTRRASTDSTPTASLRAASVLTASSSSTLRRVPSGSWPATGTLDTAATATHRRRC